MAFVFPNAVNPNPTYALVPQNSPPPPMYPYNPSFVQGPSSAVDSYPATIVKTSPSSPVIDSSKKGEDFSKAIQFKVSLKDEIRRFPLNEGANFQSLEARIRSVFNLGSSVPLSVKYTDEDGDFITVSSDSELAEAIRAYPPGGVVRLTLVPVSNIAPLIVSASSPPAVVLSPQQPNFMPQQGVFVPQQQMVGPGAPSVPSLTPAWRLQQQHQHPHHHQHNHDHKSLKADWEEKRAAWKETKRNIKQMNDSEKSQLKETVKEMKCQMKELKHHLKEQKIENRRFPKEGIMLARFVKDVSVPDNTEMTPGQQFIKTWRFRNESNRPWPPGSHLLFVGKECDRMGAPIATPVVRNVNPQEEIEVSVPMIAPPQQGRYTAYFRLADGNGKKFGQRVWVMVRVSIESSGEEKEKKQTLYA